MQHHSQPGWNQSLMWPLSRPAARQHRPLRAFLRCEGCPLSGGAEGARPGEECPSPGWAPFGAEQPRERRGSAAHGGGRRTRNSSRCAPPLAFAHWPPALPDSQSSPRLPRPPATAPLRCRFRGFFRLRADWLRAAPPAPGGAAAGAHWLRAAPPAPGGAAAGAHWLRAAPSAPGGGRPLAAGGSPRPRRRCGGRPLAAGGAARGRAGRRCRHGAARGVRAAVRPGRAPAREPAAAARPRPPGQRHRAPGPAAGAARRRLGLQRSAGAARPLHLPPRRVRGVRGAGGPRRERHGTAGAGPRLREVRRTGPRRGGSHAGAVPSAGGHRVRRAAELPAGQPALCQVHGTLLHHHSALLLLPGLLRSGSVLPGPHRHRRGEAADPGGPGHLVVCGSDSADHRWADAQRWQQLVHRVLREGQGWPQLQPVDASARSKQQPRLCLAQRGLTEL